MILVVGSVNMDISLRVVEIPKPGQTVLSESVRKSSGGKGGNQAVAVAKQGVAVTILACTGNDENGRLLLNSLNDSGVNTDFVLIKDGISSSTAYICVSDSAENTIVVDSSANMLLTANYMYENEHLFEKADFCILQMEIPYSTVKAAMDLCRKYNTKIIFNPSPLNNFENDLLNGIDYLILNENEATVLSGKDYGEASESEQEDFMKRFGIKNMIVTLGKDGCRYFASDGSSVYMDALSRKAVDTTGAGDTFLGVFAAYISEKKSIEEALFYANIASGISVTKRGAQIAMPNRAEIEAEINGQKVYKTLIKETKKDEE